MNKIQIREFLGKIVDFIVPIDQIGDDDNLFNFGMDSFDCVRILSSLEKEYNILIRNENLSLESLSSVNKIYHAVCMAPRTITAT